MSYYLPFRYILGKKSGSENNQLPTDEEKETEKKRDNSNLNKIYRGLNKDNTVVETKSTNFSTKSKNTILEVSSKISFELNKKKDLFSINRENVEIISNQAGSANTNGKFIHKI